MIISLSSFSICSFSIKCIKALSSSTNHESLVNMIKNVLNSFDCKIKTCQSFKGEFWIITRNSLKSSAEEPRKMIDQGKVTKISALGILSLIFVKNLAINGEILRLSCAVFGNFSVLHQDRSLAATFRTLDGVDEQSCKSNCIMNHQCKSININEDESICELNFRSDQDPKDTIQTYYRQKWKYLSTNYTETLIGRNCKTFGKCSNGYKCYDTCSCPGYQCVDECATGTHNCHQNAKCSNSVGSFSCQCNQGFQGNGSICKDIDECKENLQNCIISQICQNSTGSYSCFAFHRYFGKTKSWLGISNIAYNKASSQSSTDDPGILSSVANDGNRIVRENLCIITLKQWKPWWRVNLNRKAAVKGIIVIFQYIFGGVLHSVSVGNDYSNGGMNNRLCVENVTIEYRKLRMLVCQTTLYGQYVTVFTYRYARLRVCEVEVYEANVAYSGTINESKTVTIDGTTLDSFSTYGNTTGQIRSLTPSSEAIGKSWWSVDLRRKASVNIIVLKVGFYWENPLPFNISVGDWVSRFRNVNQFCVTDGHVNKNGTKTFQCPKPLVGRYVTIFANRTTTLQICDVHVYEGFYSCNDWFAFGERRNGIYTILDEHNAAFNVYCDMTSEKNSSWTLVASYSLENLEYFKTVPFYFDRPLNENNFQWGMYRQQKSKMMKLITVSSNWRFTCSFPDYGIDYRDYLRVNTTQLNPLTYKGTGNHAIVEFLNIRGQSAEDISIPFWQQDHAILHTDSSQPEYPGAFKLESVSSEDNFGYYDNCNSKFRCTERQNSTTQLWFGGLR
ncbi:uncharacterized protein LOC135695686 isoform X2 [Rhopilema esculentum]|uniref:uncharacterized protein LOC135695686 isoform X2 n=1 Tax=Rhopilema esculentum TaxID=499914 RepID=UPI0031DF4472